MITLVVIGALLVADVASPSEASAVVNTCRATNLTQATPGRPNLQATINAAHMGDTISVEGVCIGSFRIDTDLILAGKPTPERARPVLNGGGRRVLRVGASVRLTNLKITGGKAGRGTPSGTRPVAGST